MDRLEVELYKLDRHDLLVILNKLDNKDLCEFYRSMIGLSDNLLDFVENLNYGSCLTFYHSYVRITCYDSCGCAQYNYVVMLLDNKLFDCLLDKYEKKSISREDLLLLNGIE